MGGDLGLDELRGHDVERVLNAFIIPDLILRDGSFVMVDL